MVLHVFIHGNTSTMSIRCEIKYPINVKKKNGLEILYIKIPN